MDDLEVEAALDALPHPHLTSEAVEKKVKYVRYQNYGVMTLCFIAMQNGYIVVGKSAPASPDNFNKELGEHFAYKDALRQIWPLEGYLLRERLWEHEQPPSQD